jgi:phosphoesterase RecJ-like protein
MKKMTIRDCADFFRENDCFLILTHRRPDGDTLGSAATLCRGLRQLGKTAWVLRNPEATAKYAPIVEGLTTDTVAENATVVCVDTASQGMLPAAFGDLADKIRLRIDHHASATSFTEMELVDGDTAACGELIYEILMDLGVKLDKDLANSLYTAVSTDTGCFRFANTTAHTLRVAAACAEVSDDLYSLNNLYFATVSLARLQMQSYMIENAIFLQNNQVCICPIPLEIEEKIGVTEDDMDNISGYPRTIAGVKVAATLRIEKDTGKVKLSLRAAPGCDAGKICATFGGGGHAGAAGASFAMSMDEAVSALIEAIPEIK